MFVMTDAPKQLLEGLDELPRYENELQFLPSWLSFLNAINTIKTVATFGVQYWFYAQLDEIGVAGKPDPDMSVFAATRRLMGLQKKLLAGRSA